MLPPAASLLARYDTAARVASPLATVLRGASAAKKVEVPNGPLVCGSPCLLGGLLQRRLFSLTHERIYEPNIGMDHSDSEEIHPYFAFVGIAFKR